MIVVFVVLVAALAVAVIMFQDQMRRTAACARREADWRRAAESRRKRLHKVHKLAAQRAVERDDAEQLLSACRERLSKLEPSGTLVYFEARVPDAEYAKLKAQIIGSLGGEVFSARTHQDEMGG